MSDTKEVVMEFARLYQEKTGYQYTVAWAKEMSIAKRLLKFDEKQSLMHLIQTFFHGFPPDKWSFTFFAACINTVKGMSVSNLDRAVMKPRFDDEGNLIELH